jgi:glutamate synthase domain-containing protein 3
MNIDATGLYFEVLNHQVRNTRDTEIVIDNCLGQRFIAAGSHDKHIVIHGTPGNALGCYMNGTQIDVYGNAQDAIGDTMNDGAIRVWGNAGDGCGYAMRGGKIFVKGNAGYRTGIHMKEYKDIKPIIIIGNEVGSFFGEYQAGGTLVVLGMQSEKKAPVGYYCAVGMHGGRMFIRCDELPRLPSQVLARRAEEGELDEIRAPLEEFCTCFGYRMEDVFAKPFYILTPNSSNPYHSLYTSNQ